MTSATSTAAHPGESAIRIEQVGECLVVWVAAGPPPPVEVARELPAETGRIAVVMADADPSIMTELARHISEWVPERWQSVRLVAAHAGAGNGSPPAQELSEMLGVEVVAPDGDVLVVPGGSLYIMATDGGPDRTSWWRFRPGRPPEASGKRFPAPEWERDLAGFQANIAGVVVEQVPAGLWVRQPGEVHASDLAFAVPIHPKTLALIVSRAGDQPIRASDLRRLIEAVPETLRDRLAVTPYGDEPVANGRLGPVVSSAANETLRVRTGLPLKLPQAGTQIVAIGRNGAPTWSPFAWEVAWRPHAGGRIRRWIQPAEHLLPVGAGQFLLNKQWLVEVVEAGLWIREVERLDGASLVRELPLDSHHCTVVVGSGSDTGRVSPPWRSIVKLVGRLPDAARARFRLAVLQEHLVGNARRACGRMLAGGVVWMLAADGSLVPHRPAVPDAGPVPAPRTQERPAPAVSLRRPAPKPVPAADAVGRLGAPDELRVAEVVGRMAAPDELRVVASAPDAGSDHSPQYPVPVEPVPSPEAGDPLPSQPVPPTALTTALPFVPVPDRVVSEERADRASRTRVVSESSAGHEAPPPGSENDERGTGSPG
jgi:hypothetical protein